MHGRRPFLPGRPPARQPVLFSRRHIRLPKCDTMPRGNTPGLPPEKAKTDAPRLIPPRDDRELNWENARDPGLFANVRSDRIHAVLAIWTR